MNRTMILQSLNVLAGIAMLSTAMVIAPYASLADEDTAAKIHQVAQDKLPNVPGKSITAIVVNYAPGGSSPKHHHAGSVLAYVLTGEIRSENSATGAVRIYKAGDSFFEPAGSTHLVSENASKTEPASLLAIFVADDGAHLTTVDK